MSILNNKIKLLLVAGLAIFFFALSHQADAATYYWVGTSGGNVSTNSNWKLNTSGTCGGGGDKTAAFTSSDILYFHSSCTNNAVVDTTLSVGQFYLLNNYTGTVTQNASLTTNGAFQVVTGTFTSNANMQVYTFALTGAGTFNAPSGTLTIRNPSYGSSNFTHTAGTFNHNNGTVAWASNAIGGSLNTVGTTFYNLTFNTTNNTDPYTFTSGNSITVNNTLTITKGQLTAGGAATINAKGNISWTNGQQAHSSNLTINVNGASSQTVTFTGTQAGYYIPAFTFSNSSAFITYSGSTYFRVLTLTSYNGSFDTNNYALAVLNTLTFSTGTFNGGSSSITVGALTITGGTFNSTSGTLTIYNASTGNSNITHTAGGTFNHNSGTVAWSGSSCGGTVNAPNDNFYNVTFTASATNCSFTITSGTTINVHGALTFTKGYVLTGTISAKGSVSLASNSHGASGTATVNVNGTSTQSVTFNGNVTYRVPSFSFSNPLATITYSGSTVFPSLTLASGFGGTFQLGASTGMTVATALTITDGTLDLNGNNITASGTFTVGANGTLKRTGGETITTTQPTFSTGSTAIYNGTASSYNLPTTATYLTYYNLTIEGGSSTTYNLGANTTVTNNFTITSGTFSQGAYNLTIGTGSVGVSGAWVNNSTGDLTVGSGGVVNAGYINFNQSGVLIRSSSSGTQRSWTGSGVFSFSATDVQDQGGTSSITVYGGTDSGGNGANWIFSGGSSPNRTWQGNTSTTWSTNSNWIEGSAPTSDNTALFIGTYNNPASFDLSAANPGSIFISAYSSTITLAKNISLAGDFTISSGTFNAGSYDVAVADDFTYSGGTYTNTATTTIGGDLTNNSGSTFSLTDAKLVLNGSDQTITGTSTVNQLSKSVSSAATLTFEAGKTITVNATTTLSGAVGQLLSLRSSASGTQWLFNPAGGRSFSYLDVKDSNNISTEISAADYVGLTDSGNNTNWTFSLPIITVSATGTQNATTTISVSDKYMGGAFVMQNSLAGNVVTSIRLTQAGSLATSYISDIELRYKDSESGMCSNTGSLPVGTTLFGNAGAWASSTATTTGSMTVGVTPVCVYVLFSLTGTVDLDNVYDTVDLEISNPVTDVISSGVTISPATTVDIDGNTVIVTSTSGLPGISFSAADNSIATDEATTLSWTTTQNPSTCTASGNDNWTGSKSVTGTNVSTGILTLHQVYTFTLTCANNVGTSTANVYITVIHPNAPLFTLSASTSTIAAGGSSDISWVVTGGLNTPTSCTASGGWSGSKNISGGSQTISNITTSTGFTLSCTNSYGATVRSTAVTVPGTPSVDLCFDGILNQDETSIDDGGVCDDGGTTDIEAALGGYLILEMADPTINPTKFFFLNDGTGNALYIQQGDNDARKITAEGIRVTEADFDLLSCEGESNECGGVKISLTLQKISVSGSVENFTVEKTFRTTSVGRKSVQ